LLSIGNVSLLNGLNPLRIYSLQPRFGLLVGVVPVTPREQQVQISPDGRGLGSDRRAPRCGVVPARWGAAIMTTFRGWLVKSANKTGKRLRALDARVRSFDDRDLGVWDDPAQRYGISYRINKEGRGRENNDVSWRMFR